jgi:methanogenic corrinoid protein MtbC1
LYSEDDVTTLRKLKSLIDRGHRVGEACRILRDESDKERRATEPMSTSTEALRFIRDGFFRSLSNFDRRTAEQLGARLLMVPYEQVIDEIYMPLLHQTGEAWEKGDLSIAQEHFISSYVRECLGVMRHSLGGGRPSAPRIVCATPVGEHHELGLLALSIQLTLRGYDVTYLGANVPTRVLCDQMAASPPNALCLSMVQERTVESLSWFVRDLRRRMPVETILVVGGRAVRQASDELEVPPGVLVALEGLPDALVEAVFTTRSSNRMG